MAKMDWAWLQKLKSCLPMKWVFILLAHFSIAINYTLRVNISLAIVAMVQSSKVVEESECGKGDHAEPMEIKGTKYDWPASIEGYILSSYFIGYLFGMLPFALLAYFCSAKWITWAITVVNIIGCFFTPLAAMPHWGVLIMVRVIQGFTAAAAFPNMHCLISEWSTAEDRSVFTGVIYAGTSIGMIGSTLIAGFVTMAVGWENMFYIMGSLCVPWVFLWALLVTDKPPGKQAEDNDEMDEKQKMMHKWETTVKSFPVKAVFRSMPFWAVLVGHVGGNTGFYCLITQVPSFLKKALHKDLKENTIMTVMSYVAMCVVSIGGGVAFDVMRKKKIITTTTARRIGSSIAMVGMGVALLGVTFIGCDADLGIALIVIATAASGAMTVGYLGNHIDISPRFSGLLIAITNTPGTVPGIAVPQFFGLLTQESNTLRQWSIGFYVVSGILLVSYVFFMIFCSGEVQPWNEAGTEKEVEKPEDSAAPAPTPAEGPTPT